MTEDKVFRFFEAEHFRTAGTPCKNIKIDALDALKVILALI
jgi:hypothetical protein